MESGILLLAQERQSRIYISSDVSLLDWLKNANTQKMKAQTLKPND